MKKKKNGGVNTEHPSRIGSSFHKGSHGILRSKSRLNDTDSPENQGIGCNKRVRFRDLDSSQLQESATVPLERIQDPRSDEPKTSEFAFFKKLREDARSSHAHSLQQNKSQSISLKASQCSRERSISNKTLESLLPKIVTPDNLNPSISTPDYASVDMKWARPTSSIIHNMQENMEQYGAPCQNASVFSRKRHKLHQLVAKTLSVEFDELFSNGHDIVTLLLSKLFPENSGNQSSEGLKTGTSEMETQSEPFASLKFDLHINESQRTPTRNFMELEYGPSLDVGFLSCWPERMKELPSPNFLNCYSRGTFVDRVMELDYERAPQILFTEDDMEFPIRKHQYLTSRHHKELDECHYSIKPLLGQQPQTLPLGWDKDNMVSESNLSLVSTNTELILHPLLSSLHDDHHQMNLDNSFTANEFHHPIKSLHGQSLLLGWDVDSMVDDTNLSTVSQNTELSLNCFLSRSQCDDEEKNLDESFDERTSLISYHRPTSEDTELSLNCFLPNLCSDDKNKNFDDSFTEPTLSTESFISYRPQNLLSLQFSLTNDKSHEKDDMFTDNCYSNYGITCNGSNISLSPLNQLWSTRNILDESYHYPDEEAFPSSGCDFYIGSKCKPVSGSSSDHYFRAFHDLECPQSEHLSSYLTGHVNENYHSSHRGTNNHLCDNMFGIHNWSTNYFQNAFDKDKAYPLLLDKSHWMNLDEVKY